MNELLEEYKKKFDDQFPLMMFMGVSEKDIKKEIKKCIDDGKPYDPETDDDILY